MLLSYNWSNILMYVCDLTVYHYSEIRRELMDISKMIIVGMSLTLPD